MKHYKGLLLKTLSASGWELTQQNDDTDWWLDEAWRVRSTQQHWGEEIYILFLVDPQYEGTKKDTAVWAVMATKELPNERPIGNEGIITMGLQKGKFDQKMQGFVQAINDYRSNIGSKQ